MANREQLEPQPRFFLDRNLGSELLPTQLKAAGFDITIHDEKHPQDERDPWIFYSCGKENLVVITSDRGFMRSFPHMAAIALGKTTVIAFTGKTYNSKIRGAAMIAAKAKILRALRNHDDPFIGSIAADGGFQVFDEHPRPLRKQCDPRDWDSYKRACEAEGVPYGE